MLKNALLYEEQITRLYMEHQYDIKSNLACGNTGFNIEAYSRNNTYSHHFCSVDPETDEVLGVLGYEIDWVSQSVNGFYIINLCDKPSVMFVQDCLQAVDNIFRKYNLNRLEFMAYKDNKVIKNYSNFVKRCGGRIVGTLRQKVRLLDGRLHDEIIFEILKEDYINARHNREDSAD